MDLQTRQHQEQTQQAAFGTTTRGEVDFLDEGLEVHPESAICKQKFLDTLFGLGGRSVDWQSQFASRTPSRRGLYLVRQAGGQLLLRAMQYVQACRAGQHDAADRFPEIAAAVALEDDAEYSRRLRLLCLGGVSFARIAARLGQSEAAVAAWAGLYFDIHGRIASATWIYRHVILCEERRDPVYAAKLRQAYVLGEAAALALDDSDQHVVPVQETDRLFHRRVKLNVKLDRATTIASSTPATALRYTKICSELMLEGDRIALELARLKEQCREADRRHELQRHELVVAQRELALEQARLAVLPEQSAARKLNQDLRCRGSRPAERFWSSAGSCHPYAITAAARNRQQDGLKQAVPT